MAQQNKAVTDYTLLTALLQVANILVKIRDRELLPQNLTATAADILFLVNVLGEGVTPAKIGRMILRRGQTITKNLNRLERHGLIKRSKNMERKNQIRITLTVKGKELLSQAMKKEGTINVLARLTAEQRSKLTKTLSSLKETGRKELHLSEKELPWP